MVLGLLKTRIEVRADALHDLLNRAACNCPFLDFLGASVNHLVPLHFGVRS